jgi:hypothetical protein
MPGIKNTMHEFKIGKLHSGSKSGPVVKNPKQAIAIAMNDKGKNKKSDNFNTRAKDGGFKGRIS